MLALPPRRAAKKHNSFEQLAEFLMYQFGKFQSNIKILFVKFSQMFILTAFYSKFQAFPPFFLC